LIPLYRVLRYVRPDNWLCLSQRIDFATSGNRIDQRAAGPRGIASNYDGGAAASVLLRNQRCQRVNSFS